MNPRIRVGLIICGLALVVAFVLYQMYSMMLAPLLQWQQERTDDRRVYQKLTGLSARADVENTLLGWRAGRLKGIHYCALILPRRAGGSDSCTAADHEVAYRRQRTSALNTPLVPIKIIVVYDRNERVVATTTLD